MMPAHFFALAAMALASIANISFAESTLRINCKGEDAGAEVYINDTYKGECPVDIQVPEGMLKLLVQKPVSATHERTFMLNIRMSDEIVKRIEVKLGETQLNAEEKAKIAEEKMRLKVEAEAKAEEEARLIAEKKARAAEEKARKKAEAKARAEEQARLKAEAKARAAEEKAMKKAEAKARAEEQARLKAEAKVRAAEEKARRRAEAKARAENRARLKAEKKARIAEAKARAKAAAKAKAEEKVRLIAEKKARIAEEKARAEAEAKARAEEKARLKAEEEKMLASLKCPGCPEMVIIPPGHFLMGSPLSEAERNDNEGPTHEVKIAKFAMAKHEVTVGEFREFVKATAYKTDAEKNTGDMQGCYAWSNSSRKADWRPGSNWNNTGFLQDDLHPVVCVSWNDAQAYIEWISRKTGNQYRLPSEAEWEYAARAGSTTSRYWGDAPRLACKYANAADRTKFRGSWELKHECNDGYWFTAPVGSFQPNSFGLHDMLGNVWEWVADNWHESYNDAPADGRIWQEGDGTRRTVRGGSWNNSPQAVRTAKHNGYLASSRYIYNGFRLASSLP